MDLAVLGYTSGIFGSKGMSAEVSSSLAKTGLSN
jgi:hypothetical protein